MEKIKGLKLDSDKLKDQKIILSNVASLTPSDFEFSALRSKTQNLQYIGKLWLTDKNLIFKGFNLEELSPIREPADKIVMKLGDPYENSFDLSKIDKIFVGHDETFGRRHQIFSKLRISSNNDHYYFILFDDKLVSVKEEVYERSKNWQDKIESLLKPKPQVKPSVMPEVAIPKPKKLEPVIAIPKPTVKPVPKPISKPIPKLISKPIPKPDISVPKITPETKPVKAPQVTEKATPESVKEEPAVELSEDLLPNIAKLKKASASQKTGIKLKPISAKPKAKDSKLAPKVAVKPRVKEKTATEILKEEEARLRPKFKMTKVKAYEGGSTSYTPLKAIIKPIQITTTEEEESAIDKVLGDIREEMDIEILSTEFDSMAADTSINKCPFCGWLLAWDQHRCPKCRKDV
ncbi:MAG: hypothetical protein ACTSR3_17400 [Candidatus Helarchaeota archaeon]